MGSVLTVCTDYRRMPPTAPDLDSSDEHAFATAKVTVLVPEGTMNQNHESASPRPTFLFSVGAVAIAISVIVLVTASIVYATTGGSIPFEFGVVIDAGSTHTQTYLYEWRGDKDKGTGDVFQSATCTVDGGIASLSDPSVVVDCVKNVTSGGPLSVKVRPPLYLGATAGMRLLNETDPGKAQMILLVLKKEFQAAKNLKVDVKSVNIITGSVEGMSSWITVNFLQNRLALKNHELSYLESQKYWNTSYGALDMGGASTQVSFAIDPVSSENNSNILDTQLYGTDYKLFSQSFLCFGSAEAFNQHQASLIKDLNTTANILDPCLPKDARTIVNAEYLLSRPCTLTERFKSWLKDEDNKKKNFTFEGTSDFSVCTTSVGQILRRSSCQQKVFQNCVVKVEVPNVKFMAFSSFYYVTDFLNSTNVSLTEFRHNAEQWCNLTWKEIRGHSYKPSVLSHINQYCFGAVYIIKWLTEVYGFNESTWSNIVFQQQVNNTEVGWSLGYMINSTNAIPVDSPSPPFLSSLMYIALMASSGFMLLLGILLVQGYCRERCLMPQFEHKRLI